MHTQTCTCTHTPARINLQAYSRWSRALWPLTSGANRRKDKQLSGGAADGDFSPMQSSTEAIVRRWTLSKSMLARGSHRKNTALLTMITPQGSQFTKWKTAAKINTGGCVANWYHQASSQQTPKQKRSRFIKKIAIVPPSQFEKHQT